MEEVTDKRFDWFTFDINQYDARPPLSFTNEGFNFDDEFQQRDAGLLDKEPTILDEADLVRSLRTGNVNMIIPDEAHDHRRVVLSTLWPKVCTGVHSMHIVCSVSTMCVLFGRKHTFDTL